MKVWELMSPDFARCLPDARVTRVREVMRRGESRLVVLVEDYASNRFVGYLTRREAVSVTSARSDKLAREVMRDGPVLRPDMELEEALGVMADSGLYELPVLDREGRVVGTLGYRHIIKALRGAGFSPRARSVAEVETREPPTIPQDAPVTEAWSRMVYGGEEALVVVRGPDEPYPVGMLTLKDLVDSGRWYFRRESESGVTAPARVRAVMKRGVVVARGDTPIEAVAEYMVRFDFTLVPVVDDEGRVVGVVTQRDVVRAYVEGAKPGRVPVPVAVPVPAQEKEVQYVSSEQAMRQVLVEGAEAAPLGLRAAEVAVPSLPAVTPADTVEHALRVMLRSRTNQVLVVDEGGRVLGSISKRNLLYALGVKGPLWRRRPYEREFIWEVMNTEVPLVREDTPVEEVARLMVNSNSDVALVVDDKGLLAGIVTKDSLAGALVDALGDRLRVSNLMAPSGLAVVHPHTSMAGVVRRMRAYLLDALAVAEGDRLYGVITENRLPFVALEDAKRGLRSRRLIWVRRLVGGGRRLARYVKITPLLAEDLMVPIRVSVGTEDPISKAYGMMERYRVDGVPVRDGEGRVIGVITKYDMVRELARRAVRVPEVRPREVRVGGVPGGEE